MCTSTAKYSKVNGFAAHKIMWKSCTSRKTFSLAEKLPWWLDVTQSKGLTTRVSDLNINAYAAQCLGSLWERSGKLCRSSLDGSAFLEQTQSDLLAEKQKQRGRKMLILQWQRRGQRHDGGQRGNGCFLLWSVYNALRVWPPPSAALIAALSFSLSRLTDQYSDEPWHRLMLISRHNDLFCVREPAEGFISVKRMGKLRPSSVNNYACTCASSTILLLDETCKGQAATFKSSITARRIYGNTARLSWRLHPWYCRLRLLVEISDQIFAKTDKSDSL